MDPLRKLLVGTVTRGVLWGAGALAAAYGVETVSDSTAEGLAAFLVAVGLAVAATFWSKSKDKKLAES